MPMPQIDHDHDQVRMLAASIGQREAARKLGLSENTVKSICHRGGDAHKYAAAKVALARREAPNAPKPVEILVDTLANDGQATKIALMRAARKSSEHASQLPADQLLEQSANLKAVAGYAQIAGSWLSGNTTAIQVNVLSAPVDVEL